MKLMEIKKIAKQNGVNPGKMNKADLIRSIQTMEGNIPCFQTATADCAQENCLWRRDCLPV